MRWSRPWTASLFGTRASALTLKMNCRRTNAPPRPLPSNLPIYFNYLLNDLWIRTILFLYCLKCKVNNIVVLCCQSCVFHVFFPRQSLSFGSAFPCSFLNCNLRRISLGELVKHSAHTCNFTELWSSLREELHPATDVLGRHFQILYVNQLIITLNVGGCAYWKCIVA